MNFGFDNLNMYILFPRISSKRTKTEYLISKLPEVTGAPGELIMFYFFEEVGSYKSFCFVIIC